MLTFTVTAKKHFHANQWVHEKTSVCMTLNGLIGHLCYLKLKIIQPNDIFVVIKEKAKQSSISQLRESAQQHGEGYFCLSLASYRQTKNSGFETRTFISKASPSHLTVYLSNKNEIK